MVRSSSSTSSRNFLRAIYRSLWLISFSNISTPNSPSFTSRHFFDSGEKSCTNEICGLPAFACQYLRSLAVGLMIPEYYPKATRSRRTEIWIGQELDGTTSLWDLVRTLPCLNGLSQADGHMIYSLPSSFSKSIISSQPV